MFAKADQLFTALILPLPHPKIVLSDEDGKFQGVANFDLSFYISGKVYLLTFAEGQFIRKTERDFRENKSFPYFKSLFVLQCGSHSHTPLNLAGAASLYSSSASKFSEYKWKLLEFLNFPISLFDVL